MSDGNAGSGSNPLFIHSIVLFVVAAMIFGFGVFGIIKVAKASGGGMSLNDLTRLQSDARMLQSGAASTASASGTGSLQGVNSKVQQAKRTAEQGKAMWAKVKPYLSQVVYLLWGGLTGFAAFKIMKQTNWARWAAFASVVATVLFFVVTISVNQAQVEVPPAEGSPEGTPATISWVGELPEEQRPDFAVLMPLIAIGISALAGKFLWDLAVEKFEAEPAAA